MEKYSCGRIVDTRDLERVPKLEQMVETQTNNDLARGLIEFLREHRGLPNRPTFWVISYDSKWERTDYTIKEYTAWVTLKQAEYQDVRMAHVDNINNLFLYPHTKQKGNVIDAIWTFFRKLRGGAG